MLSDRAAPHTISQTRDGKEPQQPYQWPVHSCGLTTVRGSKARPCRTIVRNSTVSVGYPDFCRGHCCHRDYEHACEPMKSLSDCKEEWSPTPQDVDFQVEIGSVDRLTTVD